MRILVFLMCAFAGSAFGQLTWENPEQTFNSKPQDAVGGGEVPIYQYRQSALKIQNVKTSCGCTTTALAKTEYAPGESGEIEAKFIFAGRTGKQEKAITVTTSAAPRTTDDPPITREHRGTGKYSAGSCPLAGWGTTGPEDDSYRGC